MQLKLVYQHDSVRLLIIMGVVDSFLVQSKTIQDPVLQPAPGLQYFQRPFNALQTAMFAVSLLSVIMDESCGPSLWAFPDSLAECVFQVVLFNEIQRELVNILLGQGMI